MNKLSEFSQTLLSESLSESQMALRLLWFLTESNVGATVTTLDLVNILDQTGLRHNVNQSRLHKNLTRLKGVSFATGRLRIDLKTSNELKKQYSSYLEKSLPKIDDTILELKDFTDSRKYVLNLATQINGSYQFCFYDACAVMMRRLMEVLIIDAYESGNLESKILHNGEYMQLSGLIGVISSKQDFKLSRNAKKWMETCKKIGDNAAHSRTYMTKPLDIDDFKVDYRNLISELQGYQTS